MIAPHLGATEAAADSLPRPPRLPKSFYRRSTAGGLAFIGFALLLWLGGGGLAYGVLQSSGLSTPAAVLVALPLWLLAGQGVHLTGFVGHEGFHGSLLRSRRASAAAGIVVSSMTVVFFQAGVAIDHFNHHRYTNKPNDPDFELFGRYRGWLPRLLLTRSRANRRFFVDAIRVILQLPIAQDMRHLPFSHPVYRWFALLNLVCAAVWLAIYTVAAAYDALAVVSIIVVPLVAGYLYSGIRPYLEHNFTDDGLVTCARSRCHPVFRVLYFGNSYHFEHHLYPAVPCYRLSRVHDWLIDGGHLPENHEAFDYSLFGSYRWFLTRFQYGNKDAPLAASSR